MVIKLHPPYPARSEEPFTAIPLSVVIPNDTQVGTILEFQNTADSFPSGTVYIEIEIYK